MADPRQQTCATAMPLTARDTDGETLPSAEEGTTASTLQAPASVVEPSSTSLSRHGDGKEYGAANEAVSLSEEGVPPPPAQEAPADAAVDKAGSCARSIGAKSSVRFADGGDDDGGGGGDGFDKCDIGTEEEDDDDDDSSSPEFVDHFSLGIPSSTVRFRNARYVLYDGGEDQFMVEDRRSDDGPTAGSGEEDDDASCKQKKTEERRRRHHVLTVRRVRNGSFGQILLRATYTLASLLVLGFIFIFCFQLVLFLFLNMPASSGAVETEDPLVGAVLSVPVFLYGMASIMSIGGIFVQDTWSGHPLFRAMVRVSTTFTEWLCFGVFLGIPILTVAITLFLRSDDWWAVSAITAVSCIFAFMVVFALAVVICEVGACFEIIQLHWNPEKDIPDGGVGIPLWKRWLRLSQRAILLTQTMFYSGKRWERYVIDGMDDPPCCLNDAYTPVERSIQPYSWLTKQQCCTSNLRMFDELNPPVRNYTVEEIRDAFPITTRQNWSLERVWCGDPNARRIVVNSGPSALRPGQVSSSVACTVLGSSLVMLVLIGVLVMYEASLLVLVLIPVLVFVCCLLPIVASSVRLYNRYYKPESSLTVDGVSTTDSFHDETGHADEEAQGKAIASKGVNAAMARASSKGDSVTLTVWESVRITEPKVWFCWTMFTLEVVLFWFIPLILVYGNGNVKVGTIFLFLGGFSCLRLYFNAAAVLTEVGNVGDINFSTASSTVTVRDNVNGTHGKAPAKETLIEKLSNRDETMREETLRKKARISEIVGRISRGRQVHRWMWFFAVLVILVFMMIYSAFNEEQSDYKVKGVTLAYGDDFHYPPQPDIQYPTCKLTKGFTLPGQNSTALLDFSLLAATAFAAPEESAYILDTWFGPGKVVDEHEFVTKYRQDTNTEGGVSYKLYSFPDYPGYGVVGIRGSEAMMDWVVDVQLWSAAALAQIVRAFTPLGWIWTPILDDLVKVVNYVESANLKRVAYYKRTTQFVNDLMSGKYGNYHTVRVTGASLGGGLSIITGAQTGAYTVAISGLNAMMSRHTFDPPITKEQLNTRVFNVIPERDLIANIDDRARLFQETECRAPANSLFGCHSMWRSVCELAFKCGSEGRPVICWCVTKYGYPEPEPTGNLTWQEACASEYEDRS